MKKLKSRTDAAGHTPVGITELLCPECGGELKWDDYFGHIVGWNHLHNEPRIAHEGDIYRCQNEDCQMWWHALGSDELREGYPC